MHGDNVYAVIGTQIQSAPHYFVVTHDVFCIPTEQLHVAVGVVTRPDPLFSSLEIEGYG